jgi:thioredoxin reductase (NADPH)
MLTIDDVRAVPLFSTLAASELERLAQTSADLHLAAGECAAHEGGEEHALFAVLAGRMEVVTLFDGVERTLGWRVSRTIFGELPIALGTPLYGGYRASERSRVMRVQIREYYAIAAASPEISLKIAAPARERIGGMQGIEAEARKPSVTMVGHQWDHGCGELRQFLARNEITHDWVTPDAPDLPTRWLGERPADEDCAEDGRRGAPQSTCDARRCPAPWPCGERTACRIRHRDHRWRTGQQRRYACSWPPAELGR